MSAGLSQFNRLFDRFTRFRPFLRIVRDGHKQPPLLVFEIRIHTVSVEKRRCGIKSHFGFYGFGHHTGGQTVLRLDITFGRKVFCGFVEQIANPVHTLVVRFPTRIVGGKYIGRRRFFNEQNRSVSTRE